MKKSLKPSSEKTLSKSGKLLHGTAAQLRLTSLAGGWDKRKKELIASAAAKDQNKPL